MQPITEVKTDQIVFGSADTPQQVGTERCRSITVQAKHGNGGSIFVGGDTNQYIELKAGQSIDFGYCLASQIYAYAASANDGVNIIMEVD